MRKELMTTDIFNNPQIALYLDIKFNLFLIKQEILNKKNFGVIVALTEYHFDQYPSISVEQILDLLCEFKNHWHLIDDESTIKSIISIVS